MNTLGISCFYHDSAAALIQNGNIISAAQEERFNREKNTSRFPIQSINFCIQQAQISFDSVDHVAYFEKPFLKFSRVLIDHLVEFPFSYKSFMKSIPKWLDQRLSLPMIIDEEIGFKKDVFFVKHHLSHAASSFLPSSFEEAAILTVDGVGEWATMSRGYGSGNNIFLTEEIRYPHSLGLLYTTFTVFIGFDANGGEGKTMGLAAFGEPKYLSKLKTIVKVLEDGSFFMDPKYFSFRSGRSMWSHHFIELFGKPRFKDEPLEQRHWDLAASVQALLEEIMILNAQILQKKTRMKKLCLAGGVALNCVTNHKILEQTDFKEIFVQPAAGDAGGALGAALYVQNCLLKKERVTQTHSFFGPSFSNREIEKVLIMHQLSFTQLDDEEMCLKVAEALAENKIVGWFQDRMEYGPRALGNRSILASACDKGMKDRLNGKIKKRESFRPFAPLIPLSKVKDYFHLIGSSPYMLMAAKVIEEKSGFIPSAVHVDGTARVQTIEREGNRKLYRILEIFEEKTGVPILLNTSFNRKGEPVVCHPIHAIDCFINTELDILVIGNFLVNKGYR
jgi:carbamoyltransferase